MEQDINKIVAALCSTTAADDSEPEKSDTECDFEYYDPNDEDEDEDEDEYDEDNMWDRYIDDTYNSLTEARTVSDCIDKLKDIYETLDDEDYRYYSDNYNSLEDLVSELENVIESLESAADDYVTFDRYQG